MTLKVNQMCKTEWGYLIPRSHFTEGIPKYAIIECLYSNLSTFKVEHHTMSMKEIREALGVKKNERIEIL